MAEVSVDWSSIKLVILDVDGTLYRQTPLRIRMFVKLCAHLAIRPYAWRTLWWLQRFRKMRETIPAGPLEETLESYQYSIVARSLKVDVEKIRQTITRWIHKEPLPHLKACMYPGVDLFLQTLTEKGILYAFYTDYPLQEKLQSMGITSTSAFSSEDAYINRMKPDPTGLEYISNLHQIPASQCLMIGDRYEKDGMCAEAAGMPYIILDQQNKSFYSALSADLRNLPIAG